MGRFFRGRQAAEMLSSVDDDPSFPMPPLSNRKQVAIFVVLTLLLTVAAVWGGRAWFRSTHTLTFAVGADTDIDARFAAKLSTVLTNSGSSLRLKIVKNADNDKAVGQFDRKQADLALLRTDAPISARARAIATLDHDLVLLLSPKDRAVSSLAALKGKKVAIIGDDRNAAFLKRLLDLYGFAGSQVIRDRGLHGHSARTASQAREYGAVLAMDHLSKISADKSYERVLKGPVGFKLNEISEAKAVARKIPGVSEESFDAGLLSASPKVPDEEIDTVGLQWILVAQSTMSEQKGTELARTILENKPELALANEFATQIEPADTDKDALIAAHRGRGPIYRRRHALLQRPLQRLHLSWNGGAQHLRLAVGRHLTPLSRASRPKKAGELATSLLDIGERVDEANSLELLETIQEELEGLLKKVVTGLRDGTISGDGLETFRLGYDFVRDSLDLRRCAVDPSRWALIRLNDARRRR